MTHPVSIETSTGDGLLMAMRAGAMLSNMREAWWIPVGDVPVEDNPLGRILVNGQRTLPHSIMVNRRGRRFTNEAANYNAFGAAFHVEDVSRFEYANLPCWLIFDQSYVDTYGFRVAAGGGGGQVPSWVPRGDTPAELAAAVGMDGDELERTVERWNTLCAEGHDPDFGRGDSAFDCWWGDPHRKGRRDATLGPLDRGPYYAYEIHSGTLGTKGGPRVDPERPRARPGRRADRRAVRGRQRHGVAVRHDLRRARWHDRAGHGVRLPRGTSRRGSLTRPLSDEPPVPDRVLAGIRGHQRYRTPREPMLGITSGARTVTIISTTMVTWSPELILVTRPDWSCPTAAGPTPAGSAGPLERVRRFCNTVNRENGADAMAQHVRARRVAGAARGIGSGRAAPPTCGG